MDNSTNAIPQLPALDPDTTFLLRTIFAGAYMGTLAYGVHATLYFLCMTLLLKGKKAKDVAWGWVTYTTVVFSVATIYMGCNTDWTQLLFIDQGYSYPGGPLEWYVNQPDLAVANTANAAYVVTNALTDALMVYRCWIVWDRSFLAVSFPTLLYLGSTATSIVAVIQLTTPGTVIESAFSWLTPYTSLSTALNIIITLMITGKLFGARNRLRSALGATHSRMYTSIAAMIIESAALYTAVNIIFLVTLIESNAVLNIVLAVQAQIMAICPLLILIRVARGRAYSTEAVNGSSVQSMQFRKHTEVNSSKEITFSTERTYNGGSQTWNATETKASV